MLIVLYSLAGYNGTMFSCYILIVMLAFGFTGAVSAQTNPGSPAPVPAASAGEAVPGTVSGGGAFFPLSPLIEAALSGSLLWHPDWPLAIPPDSFEPARQPGVSVTLTLEAVQETGDPVSTEFWYSRDSGGRLTGFPYFINGVFCQAQAFFDPQDGVLRGMRVVGEGDPREIEFTAMMKDCRSWAGLYRAVFIPSRCFNTWAGKSPNPGLTRRAARLASFP